MLAAEPGEFAASERPVRTDVIGVPDAARPVPDGGIGSAGESLRDQSPAGDGDGLTHVDSGRVLLDLAERGHAWTTDPTPARRLRRASGSDERKTRSLLPGTVVRVRWGSRREWPG